MPRLTHRPSVRNVVSSPSARTTSTTAASVRVIHTSAPPPGRLLAFGLPGSSTWIAGPRSPSGVFWCSVGVLARGDDRVRARSKGS